jgi:type II secretory pathway predicted ATPase ExeA
MYQSHWGLDETPFHTQLDPRFFYQSPTHEEALARLHFLVEYRRRLGLLIGPQGSGKSLLLEVFAGELRREGVPVARVNLLGLDRVEMLWLLAGELGINPRRDTPPPALWRSVTDRITGHRYQQLDTVLLFDEADRATEDVLSQVARLAQFDCSPEARVTIVLAGCLERISRFGDSLLERAELRIDVAPWEPTDTQGYVQASLERAGRKAPVFDPPAIERLHQLAEGIPRRITQLADLALLAGAGRNLQQIDADTIDSVYNELGVVDV